MVCVCVVLSIGRRWQDTGAANVPAIETVELRIAIAVRRSFWALSNIVHVGVDHGITSCSTTIVAAMQKVSGGPLKQTEQICIYWPHQ